MRYSDFKNTTSGRLVPTLYGERAFVPNPLPPTLDMTVLALPFAEAMAAVGELRGACRRLQNAYILIRPLQRLEALTSSAIEGTYSTDNELLLAEAEVGSSPSDDTQEVANYLVALSSSLARLEDEPISNRLLRDAHRILLSNVGKHRGLNKLPGEFKRDQNMIGGKNLKDARFIPPPPNESADCMADLEKFINRAEATRSEALIDIGLAHYQIETIHPFADGNGRVGRMLISLMAVKSGLLHVPALYLSPVIERDKDQYIDTLYNVSATGNWEQWLTYYFNVVFRSCYETISTIDRLLLLQQQFRERAGNAMRSANILSIIDMLFERPVITPRKIVERLGITDVAARNLLNKLCEMDILYEYKEVYPKAFIALEIVKASSPVESDA